MRQLAAFGHAGLMFGMLGIIVALVAINSSLKPYTGGSVLIFAAMFWLVGIAFVAAEWVEGKLQP